MPSPPADHKPGIVRRTASALLRRRNLALLAVTIAFAVWGVVRYEKLVLAPREGAGREVALEDLLADRWYETDEGRELTARLARATDSRAMQLAKGLYYHQYKSRYGPGIKSTQYVRVGPDQYPEIYEMVADACRALGQVAGDTVPVPEVWLGYNGARSIEVTNYTNPTIIIGNDFLWAYKPEELRYLLARQIGHLQCRHTYLLDVTKGVRAVIDSALPGFVSRALVGGLAGSLVEWTREAHITADRAGLLVVGDVDLACAALIKLNIQASLDDFYGQPNPEAFAMQADVLGGDHVTATAAAFAELKNPNPFLTARVADLLAFHAANQSLFKDRTLDDSSGRAGFEAGVIDSAGTVDK